MIEIVDYQAQWPEEFLKIGVHLRRHLGDLALRIDHIGSTSVPNLPAKDLIDIQITVAERTPAVAQAFYSAGFIKSRHETDHVPPEQPAEPHHWEKWLFKSGEGWREVNAHVRMPDRANQRYALLMRDYLRTFPMAAQAYGQTKRAIIQHHPEDDMEVYYDIKDPVFDIIFCGAEYWAAQTNWQVSASDC